MRLNEITLALEIKAFRIMGEAINPLHLVASETMIQKRIFFCFTFHDR